MPEALELESAIDRAEYDVLLADPAGRKSLHLQMHRMGGKSDAEADRAWARACYRLLKALDDTGDLARLVPNTKLRFDSEMTARGER